MWGLRGPPYRLTEGWRVGWFIGGSGLRNVWINRYEFLNVGIMVVNWENYLDEFGIESIEE